MIWDNQSTDKWSVQAVKRYLNKGLEIEFWSIESFSSLVSLIFINNFTSYIK